MASSISQQLEELLNPLPKFADPEDDDEEATRAKVAEKFAEDEENEDELGLSALRRRNTELLPETDRRYKGKAVSRQQLLKDSDGSDDDDDYDDYDDEEEEEGEEKYSSIAELEEDEEVVSSDEDVSGAPESSSVVQFPKKVNYNKLTEGMDDLGVSDEEDDEDDGSGKDEEEGDSDMDESPDEEMGDSVGDDDTVAVSTFSQEKVDEEVQKGQAVKNQLALWDQLLEARIKIQKALVTANQLPQPQTLPEFKTRGGPDMAAALKKSHKALKALQRSLLELHDQLLLRDATTRSVVEGKEGDEEGAAQEHGRPKRKLDMAEYPDLAAKRFAAFQPYRDATLQKWHDKTRLNTGRGSQGFGAFDRSILTQLQQVLSDQDRLVRRTQTRRSTYRILGKKEAPAVTSDPTEEAEPQQLKANQHLKDLDEDIFDDDDFYHQLLRELIERKTLAADPNDQVAMGRQWLAIQKLRSKIKKKVDTRASKGRKVRFHIHSKLVNFMAPVDCSTMSDEARSELFRGLFGQSSQSLPPTGEVDAQENPSMEEP